MRMSGFGWLHEVVHVTRDGAAVREWDVAVDELSASEVPTFLVVFVSSRAGLTSYVRRLLCVVCCVLLLLCD